MAAEKKRKSPLSRTNLKKESMLMIRAAPRDKLLIEKAAGRLGQTVSSFMLENSIRAAHRELAEFDRLRLSVRDASAFYNALHDPPAPNRALKEAFTDYKKRSKK